MSTATGAFTPAQRVLHWLMAICILAMLFIGVFIASTISPDYPALVTSHKTLGIAILLLALLRLAIRLRAGAPPLPADLPPPLKLAARLSHLAFYLLMFAMPLIGWAMLSAAGVPITLAGGLRLPPITAPSRDLHALLWNAHQLLGLAFFALVLLHLAAALFHALIRRDGVFAQMTTGAGNERSKRLLFLKKKQRDFGPAQRRRLAGNLCVHGFPQNAIYFDPISFVLVLEPVENIGIQAHADSFLPGLMELPCVAPILRRSLGNIPQYPAPDFSAPQAAPLVLR